MKILAVCGNGLGSSLILKMNIQSVLKELNLTNVQVDHCDLTSVASENADLIVVTKDLASNFNGSVPLISLASVMSKHELREKLQSFMAIC
ncbi:MAG: PTS sugar transporter subunit IIB [Planctomycetaceae bacterium]|nr:PTS sugar transporter subunit IIB [Planctomycetaceae bacterium]